MKQDYFEMILEDQVLIFAMHAPANNLMTGAFFMAYEDAVQKVQCMIEKKQIKGVIITGNGRQFSVGADVEELIGQTSQEDFREGEELPWRHCKQKGTFTFWRKLPVPVISVVTGFCMGSGCEIAINSHFRICEKTARIGQPESTFGILPALGGITSTIENCGMQNAIEMVFSGQLLSAADAYQVGWADLIVEKKQGVTAAKQLLGQIEEMTVESSYCPEEAKRYLEAFKGEKK